MNAKASKTLAIALGMLGALAASTASALPGDFDASFTGGLFDLSISDCSGGATSVAVQHDGRILVGGFSNAGSTCGNSLWSLIRTHADGTLDTTFGGGNGFVNVAVGGVGSALGDFFGEHEGVLAALAVQADGKIVGVGTGFDTTGNIYTIHVVRWNADGSLDNGFGTGGMVDTNLGATSSPQVGLAVPSAVALQSDGKILVAIASTIVSNHTSGVLRYTTTGSLDPSFGSNGFAELTSELRHPKVIVPSLAVQADGRILFGASRSIWNPVVARLTTTGALDASFGTGGIAEAPSGQTQGPVEQVTSLVPQPDGTIVGLARSNVSWLFRMRRNGDPDPTFGPHHQSYVRVASAVGPVIVLPTGAIRVYVGAPNLNVQVNGYTSSGAVDAAFVQTGGTTPGQSLQPSGGDTFAALALQPDGRFLAAGVSTANDDAVIGRYEGDLLQLRPKTFSFASRSGVAPSSLQVSATATIANLTANAQVPITVTGGSYSINGGAFTTRLGYVANGDVVAVENTSSATSGGSVTTTLHVGGFAPPNAPWVVDGSQVVAQFTTTTQ